MQDRLLHEAKIEAAKKKISLTAFIQEAVEEKLGHGKLSSESVHDFKIITFKGTGTNPGVDLDNSASLLDLMGD
jgi:hypothetical protein